MKHLYFLAVPIILPSLVLAAQSVRLPFAARERFVVTTGYTTWPTHIQKDSYAIDFTQVGCNAYGKPAVAALAGTAWLIDENGYNGGYGTQLLVLTENNVVTRYAHLIPGSIPVNAGDAVPQGTIIGEIGDTGLVMGSACSEHPGTHVHFAMYTENADGSFTAKRPEPISGYTGIVAGTWYTSDNVLAATESNVAALVTVFNDLLGNNALRVTPPSPNGNVSVASPKTQDSFASPSPSPQPSPSPPAANPPPTLSLENPTPPDLSIIVGTTSMANVPSGDGGSNPLSGSGGVSVLISPSAPITIPTTTLVSSTPQLKVTPPDDPSDDTVSACRE